MVNNPDYIAFRVQDGPGSHAFVAALEPGERGSFPWARWYSESAPNGEFRKVPGGYERFAVSEAVAETLIDIIRAGRSLPDDLLAQLPIAEFGAPRARVRVRVAAGRDGRVRGA